jgi:hypothetical protein
VQIPFYPAYHRQNCRQAKKPKVYKPAECCFSEILLGKYRDENKIAEAEAEKKRQQEENDSRLEIEKNVSEFKNQVFLDHLLSS